MTYSIHTDTIKTGLLFGLVAFLGWGWYREHMEVRHLIEVGTSLGAGWEQCMASLEPRVTGVEKELSTALGRDVHPATLEAQP